MFSFLTAWFRAKFIDVFAMISWWDEIVSWALQSRTILQFMNGNVCFISYVLMLVCLCVYVCVCRFMKALTANDCHSHNLFVCLNLAAIFFQADYGMAVVSSFIVHTSTIHKIMTLNHLSLNNDDTNQQELRGEIQQENKDREIEREKKRGS